MHINIEFKARCNDVDRVRAFLEKEGAEYKGKDHQIDIYFNVPRGRLKLRKGKIESFLIGYEREDYLDAKQSNVILFKTDPESSLQEVLTTTLGIKVIIDKERDIYFIGNVKFHIDEVSELGTFIEVEAIDYDGNIGKEKLQEQCDLYKKLLGVQDSDLIAKSYSDLLMEKS